ncbi:MAG: S46 family peptidase [marine benthic group bacterium]|nr:S46 family peptidase [Gemmatimonadota bacterium]
MTNIGVRHFAVLAAVLAMACSSAPPPEPAPAHAPPPPVAETTPAGLLDAPQAAVDMSDMVELNGTEMGTMWTFENPPLDYWEDTYGFRPSTEWLEHVRLASGRVPGCSASFVSADGLVITNNHCARGCIDAVSTDENDYLNDGFYAATDGEELVCPNYYLDQLIEIEDITAELRSVAEAGMSDADINAARDARGEELSAACEEATGLRCQVVSLFHGGQYKLYKFHRYPTVKLVFTPEMQAAFFGGDADNFTYPRYDLDITFLRAYDEDGESPASTPHYFEWDPEGAAEGELVFVTGNPGSTARQITLSQYMYQRVVFHPMILDFFDQRLEVMHAIAAADPDRGRAMQNQIFGFENTQKLYRGQLGGLRDVDLTARKIRWENEFRAAVEADPALQAEYGDVWDRIAGINETMAKLAPTVYLNNPSFLNPSAHLQLAGQLSQYVQIAAMPEDQRPPNWNRLEGAIREPGEMHMDQSLGMLTGRLALAQEWLPAEAVLVQAVQPGETPEAAARRLIESSRVGEAEFRESLMSGGVEGLQTTTDPLVQLALAMRAEQQSALGKWQDANASEEVQNERFASALFAVYGTDLPPDATFTLRITDGVVQRYQYNGTYAPAQTSIYGLYGRAEEFDNEMPFTLAPAFDAARDVVDMSIPINFVSTNDITGGNSGSPVIDQEARWVGIAFDGNVESLPNEFLFAAENGRTVSVHSAGITEALRSVYNAHELLDELLSGSN